MDDPVYGDSARRQPKSESGHKKSSVAQAMVSPQLSATELSLAPCVLCEQGIINFISVTHSNDTED